MKNKQTIQTEINQVNKQIDKVNNNLIDALQTVGIEYINLYQYIDTLNHLKQLKNKLKTELILCNE